MPRAKISELRRRKKTKEGESGRRLKRKRYRYLDLIEVLSLRPINEEIAPRH